MARQNSDRRLDNIFKEIMSDEEFCSLFPVGKDEYTNIAQGLNSDNKMIVALATLLKDVDTTINKHHKNGSLDNKKDGIDQLEKGEQDSIYRKIAIIVTE